MEDFLELTNFKDILSNPFSRPGQCTQESPSPSFIKMMVEYKSQNPNSIWDWDIDCGMVSR